MQNFQLKTVIFFDKLLPGDIVMTDGEFDIEESVALYCVKVKTPSFTKDK